MLIGIDPALSGELLKILDEMGHGDQLVVADRNYPVYSSGRPVVRMGDVGVVRTLRAVLSVFPLDTYVHYPLERMEVENNPGLLAPVQLEVLNLVRAKYLPEIEFGVVPRLEFYERARSARAIIHTLESEPYGCFILTKGVVFETDKLPPKK